VSESITAILDPSQEMDRLVATAIVLNPVSDVHDLLERLTLPKAIELAFLVVKEKGVDHVYSPPNAGGSCFNWHIQTDEPGCIVGHILYRFGVPKENLNGAYITAPAFNFSYLFASPKVNAFLTGLQWRQDDRDTWGQALTGALKDILGIKDANPGVQDVGSNGA